MVATQQFRSLGPREIQIAAAAYDAVFQEVDRVTSGDGTRDVIARYIVEKVLSGERDPVRLRDGALAHLGNPAHVL
ncbi:MAG: hypothetical protein M3158_00070 [Pseudomonadota bacterium]|nr:hypothetical protein [Pseudomonadota bacterium]